METRCRALFLLEVFIPKTIKTTVKTKKANIKPLLHVVSFSGGKDSTALLLRMLEEKMPVDLILFCDTGLEFPQMYEHLKKVEQYTGRTITRLKSERSFEDYFFNYVPIHPQAGENNHAGLGWANHNCRWCTGRLKTHVVNSYLSDLRKRYTVVQYIGIAADETRRCRDLRYPLVEWGMTEPDCLAYCKARGFDWGGLYDIFRRVSCWCCPLQPLSELRLLRKGFPQLWQQLLAWDAGAWNQFRPDYSAQQLEWRFALEEQRTAQGLPNKGRAFYSAMRQHFADKAALS